MAKISQIELGDFFAIIERKDVKNVHLSVYPPEGAVRISAPREMPLDHLRAYVISKLDWIKNQRRKIQSQERESPREHLERESHYVWGKRFLMTLEQRDQPPTVKLSHRKIVLTVRPDTDAERRNAIMSDWYRSLMKDAIPALIAKWEPKMGVKVNRFFVRRMKTKWGSCMPSKGSIRLNTELAKKPRECLEYLVVHEMTHLLEPTHNARFISLLDHFLPQWRQHRATLNRLPVRHEFWKY